MRLTAMGFLIWQEVFWNGLDEYQANAYQPNFRPIRSKNNPFVGGDVESMVRNYKGVETERVLRGGTWDHMFWHLRVADRNGKNQQP